MSLVGYTTYYWSICLMCIATVCQDKDDKVHMNQMKEIMGMDGAVLKR